MTSCSEEPAATSFPCAIATNCPRYSCCSLPLNLLYASSLRERSVFICCSPLPCLGQNRPNKTGWQRSVLNQTTGDSYTMVTPCAASARRSSVGLKARSPVNRTLRGRPPPLQPKPGALAPGGDCANVMWSDLVAVR